MSRIRGLLLRRRINPKQIISAILSPDSCTKRASTLSPIPYAWSAAGRQQRGVRVTYVLFVDESLTFCTLETEVVAPSCWLYMYFCLDFFNYFSHDVAVPFLGPTLPRLSSVGKVRPAEKESKSEVVRLSFLRTDSIYWS